MHLFKISAINVITFSTHHIDIIIFSLIAQPNLNKVHPIRVKKQVRFIMAIKKWYSTHAQVFTQTLTHKKRKNKKK